MRAKRLVLIGAALLAVLAGCSSSSETRVIIGAGTTLVDSQLMSEIVAAYGEVEPDVDLSVVGLSSAEAIALAEAGDADLIITHARESLGEFLTQHSESVRFDVFASKFFIVADPTISLSAASVEDAFAAIAEQEITFVSRDDGSGTNAAELAAWDRAGVDPSGASWYLRTSTGMGATLQVTDQRHATTLAEHGAFIASQGTLSLVPVANTEIRNPYDLTVVDVGKNPAAMAFAEWLTSAQGVAAITTANVNLFGEQVYAAP